MFLKSQPKVNTVLQELIWFYEPSCKPAASNAWRHSARPAREQPGRRRLSCTPRAPSCLRGIFWVLSPCRHSDAQGDPGAPVPPPNPWVLRDFPGAPSGDGEILSRCLFWRWDGSISPRILAKHLQRAQPRASLLGPSSSANLFGLCLLLPPHIVLQSASHSRTGVGPRASPEPSRFGFPSPGRIAH